MVRRIIRKDVRNTLKYARREEREKVLGKKSSLFRTRKPTTRVRVFLKFGAPFLESFRNRTVKRYGGRFETIRAELLPSSYESPIEIGMQYGFRDRPIGSVRIGFKEKTVVIEGIQGDPDAREAIVEVNRHLEIPWANRLIKVVESHAKKTGYKMVLIRRPETLYHYRLPAHMYSEKDREEKYFRKVRWNMRNLYGRVAAALGYRETPRYFVKEL